MSTTVTITITVDGGNVSVSTATGAAKPSGARRSEPLPKATGALCTMGDVYLDAPGKKGGIIHDMADKDLSWWRDALTANIADPEKSRFRDKNQAQRDGIETEMHNRANGGSDDGGKGTSVEIVADDVTLLGKPEGRGDDGGGQRREYATRDGGQRQQQRRDTRDDYDAGAPPPQGDDDIPF